MINLLILADGGGSIGFGHIMRCLAIKNAWKYGAVKLLTHMEGGEPSPDGTDIFFDWFDRPEQLSQFALKNTVLLVDSYRPGVDFFRFIKKIFQFVVVLDDYNRIPYPVDLVICPGIYGKNIDYHNQTAKVAGGVEYVVVRPEVLAIKRTKVQMNVRTVLVTFGGSQHNEALYQDVVNILELYSYQIIVVTGNNQLAKKIISSSAKVYGKVEPDIMASLMASADIAISSAGQTLNEFAWLGIPVFSIKTGADQQENWEYYKNHHLSLDAVSCGDVNWKSALELALKRATYKCRMEKFSRLKNALTDSGAKSICSLINRYKNAL